MKKTTVFFFFFFTVTMLSSQMIDFRISSDLILKGDSVRACAQDPSENYEALHDVDWELYYENTLITSRLSDTGVFEASCGEVGLYTLKVYSDNYDPASKNFEVIDTPNCKVGTFYLYEDPGNICTMYFILDEPDTVYLGNDNYSIHDSIRFFQSNVLNTYPLNEKVCLKYYAISGEGWCGGIIYSPPHPNCEGVRYKIISATPFTTSIENWDSHVNIFPNPFTNTINIVLKEQGKYHYKIFNTMGQCLQSNIFNGTKKELFLENLPSNNIYILEVNDDNKTFKTKIIKE
ncbi:MAG: T9SS type A sorting domain-containing protein [bacterium]